MLSSSLGGIIIVSWLAVSLVVIVGTLAVAAGPVRDGGRTPWPLIGLGLALVALLAAAVWVTLWPSSCYPADATIFLTLDNSSLMTDARMEEATRLACRDDARHVVALWGAASLAGIALWAVAAWRTARSSRRPAEPRVLARTR